jgi:hypothetical protein
VRYGALEVRRRTQPSGGGTHAEDDQVCALLPGDLYDKVRGFTVFHRCLRRVTQIGLIWNYFVKAVKCLGYG